MSLVFEYATTPSLAFPLTQLSLFYAALGTLVVHFCQQLVEQTATAIDLPSRTLRASRAGINIGGLVWVLDIAGFFIYPQLGLDGLKLEPALVALLVNAVTARVAVPHLSCSTNAKRVGLAGLGLACGMTFGHVLLSYGYNGNIVVVNLAAILASVALAVLLAVALALKHRWARIQTLRTEFRPLSWRDKVVAGCVVVVLHWCLTNAFPLRISAPEHGSESVKLLIAVLIFGLAIAADQMQNVNSERVRQRILRKAIFPYAGDASLDEVRRDIHLSLISERLPQLLNRDRLVLHFQPIVTAEPHISHFEALLRVSDKVLGALNPEHFMLACELQHQTTRVDRMIIAIALDQLRLWCDSDMPSPVLNVNVSPATLLEPEFAQWINSETRLRALPAGSLRLEITEHAIIASGEKMIRLIATLQQEGIGVVMDDFGSGYSSLGLLAELPISGFKCDRLFIKDIGKDRRRQLLLQRIAELAHDLHLPVTAEGVETQDELDIVLACGIHSIQGYLFARPMPAHEIPDWIGARHAAAASALQTGAQARPLAGFPFPAAHALAHRH